MSPLVKATNAQWSEFEATGQVGDFYFSESEEAGVACYIAILLPKGEGKDLCILPLITGERSGHEGRPVWWWNGDQEKPTLEPSILHYSDPPWHGFLRDGQLVNA